MADPVIALPEESRDAPLSTRTPALRLLRRHDFRDLGALVPSLVDRRNVQQANALVQASAQAVSIGGWALAAALLAVLPISTFFAVNAASFLVGYAAGSIVSGALLAHRPLRRKALASLVAWTLYLPAYGRWRSAGRCGSRSRAPSQRPAGRVPPWSYSSRQRRRTFRTRCSAACSG